MSYPPPYGGWDPRQFDPHAAMQAARRGATARSILDVGALLGLLAGVGFWSAFFVKMIAPADVFEIFLTMALSAGYAIILPMLLSLLAPWTQAGMALARTRHKTWGQVIAVAAAAFMVFHAFRVIWAWWGSRPAAVATGEDVGLAIGTAIIFIVVPALAWVQAAPDRWVAEVMQAQEVRRLTASQQANLMAAEMSYARAMSLLRRGLANCTAAERAEVAGIFIALQKTENEAVDRILGHMEVTTGINGGPRLLDDPHLNERYAQLHDKLTNLYVETPAHYEELLPAPAPALAAATGATIPAMVRGAHQDAVPAPAEALVSAAASAGSFRGESPQGAATRGEPPQYAAEFRAAREAFRDQGFTAKTLGDLIKKSDRTGREVIRAWVAAGLVERGDSGAYYIIEGA